jgi:hypothetical protein
MRATFYKKQLQKVPAFPGQEFRQTFIEGNQTFIVDIKRLDSGNFTLEIYISKRVHTSSGPRIVEHRLSDNAIKKLNSSTQERLIKAVKDFYDWDED